MTKMLLVFLVVLTFVSPLFAQEVDTAWVRRYSGVFPYHLSIDPAGNVYVMGQDFTLKYAANGDQLWVWQFGGSDNAIDDSGNVYITGAGGTSRYDSSGNQLWNRTWGSGAAKKPSDIWWPGPNALTLDNAGNICVTGMYYTGSSLDCATIEYYPDGDTAWVTIVNAGDDVNGGFDIAMDPSGNLYVTGVTGHTNGYGRLTIKYHPDGDTAWVRTYIPTVPPGWPYSAEGDAITVDYSGNVFTTGWGRTVAYDSSANLLWVQEMSWADMAAGDSGMIYFAGTSDSMDYVVAKYHSNGGVAWTRTYNGPANDTDQVTSMALDNQGNVYVTSTSVGSATRYDYATVKYDPYGNRLWSQRFDGGFPLNSDAATDVEVDAQGNIYVTGSSQNSTGNGDCVTIKYLPTLFFRGDADGDGKVTVSDAVYFINYLFRSGPKPAPFQSGDANRDGEVTIVDVIYLINYLFKGGPSPNC